MGAVYISTSTEWATYADGSPLIGEHADFSTIDRRIDGVDPEILEAMVQEATGESLADLGVDYVDDLPDGLDEAAEMEILTRAGADSLRKQLREDVRKLAVADGEVSFSFDGRRWIVSTGGYSHGDSPSDEYDSINRLLASEVLVDPVDGGTFTDVPAIGATVAILDTLAQTALTALTKVGLNETALAAAREALEDARCDITGTASTLRTALTRITQERTDAAWDQATQARMDAQAEAHRAEQARLAAAAATP